MVFSIFTHNHYRLFKNYSSSLVHYFSIINDCGCGYGCVPVILGCGFKRWSLYIILHLLQGLLPSTSLNFMFYAGETTVS